MLEDEDRQHDDNEDQQQRDALDRSCTLLVLLRLVRGRIRAGLGPGEGVVGSWRTEILANLVPVFCTIEQFTTMLK